MGLRIFQINSIDGGISPSAFNYPEGTFNMSLGIDPDIESESSVRTSGIIKPVSYTKFSGTEITGFPMWITTNPETLNSYVYASDGKLHSFDRLIAMRTTDEASTSFPITITGGAGNGQFWYNNFLYLMEGGDISRYGPFDSAHISGIAVETNVWTGSLFSQTALTNTTYPTLRGAIMPNHVGHVHVDGAAYICDVTAGGKGVVHRIKTSPTLDYDGQTGNFTVGDTLTGGTSGATAIIVADNDAGATGTLTLDVVIGAFQNNETITDTGAGSATVNGTLIPGAGNNGTTYAALDLPFNYIPTAIASWGNDVAIAAMQNSGSTSQEINQGQAAIFLWDTFSQSFYRQIPVDDPLVTGMSNKNGNLIVFSGNASSGARISQYIGGETLQQTGFLEEGISPFAGAVDTLADRIAFGGFVSYPTTSSCVFAVGSKNGTKMGMQNIVRTSSAGTNTPVVTSIGYVQQADGKTPKLIVGWGEDNDKGLDRFAGGGTLKSRFRTPLIHIGKKFRVASIRIPLEAPIDANTSIIPNVLTNNLDQSTEMTVINNAAYSGKDIIVQRWPEIRINGNENLLIDFEWALTRPTGIKFPITVTVDIDEDDKTA